MTPDMLPMLAIVLIIIFSPSSQDQPSLPQEMSNRVSYEQSIQAQDPERDWTQGELPPFSTNCSSGSEESYEPNDRPSQASAISAGNFTGGICAEEPDFYQINISGRWRLDLSFTHRTGDIDLYVWDNNQNRM